MSPISNPYGTYPQNLPWVVWRRKAQVHISSQLTPFVVEEKQLYTELTPEDGAHHSIRKPERGHYTGSWFQLPESSWLTLFDIFSNLLRSLFQGVQLLLRHSTLSTHSISCCSHFMVQPVSEFPQNSTYIYLVMTMQILGGGSACFAKHFSK